MIKPEEDGITHLNVYSQAKTELGRFLSNFACTDIQLPEGKFRSIEGYWYWLSTNHPDRDQLKLQYSWSAKKVGREYKKTHAIHDPDFVNKIKAAILIKLNTFPDMKRRLEECTLPLKHYYVFGTKVHEDIASQWIIDYLETFKKVKNDI